MDMLLISGKPEPGTMYTTTIRGSPITSKVPLSHHSPPSIRAPPPHQRPPMSEVAPLLPSLPITSKVLPITQPTVTKPPHHGACTFQKNPDGRETMVFVVGHIDWICSVVLKTFYSFSNQATGKVDGGALGHLQHYRTGMI